ncbi:NAD(P)H-hydrate dehydratase [Nitrospirota bacterium]
MQRVDRRTIRSFGIPGPVLMERAGLAVVSRITERFGGSKVLVIAGTGNNGGDGIMAARELRNIGYRTSVLIAGKKEKLSRDAAAQYRSADAMGVPIRFYSSFIKPRPEELHGAIIVDALVGTGLAKDIKGSLARTIDTINDSGCPVVSVDIPSGVSADTGQVLGTAVQADFTVTFGTLKRGHLLYPGAELSGKVFVHDIGFPRQLLGEITCNVPGSHEMRLLIPERPPDSHKGDFGHLLSIAGSRGKTGAAFMSAEAALRAGAGLVTLAAPEALSDIYQARVTEAMVLPLPSGAGGNLSFEALEGILAFASEKATAIAMGPGLGQDKETTRLVRDVLENSPVPVVLDADGINALGSKAASLLSNTRAPVVLTPHPGEFSRISGMSVPKIEADRPGNALAFAKKCGAYVVLKGAPTVIAGPEGELFINTTGGSGLSKGGTGDILTGMIGALCAMGMSPLEASLLGSYMHGLAGDLAASALGDFSTMASDVIGHIPDAFRSLSGEDV